MDNSDKPSDIFSKTSHVEKLAEQQAVAYSNASVQFSSIIVANLMIINSGALFAFPAYLSKIVTINPTLVEATVSASAAFVVGVVCATLCGYVAYLNYGMLKFDAYRESYKEIIELKYPLSSGLSEELRNWRTETLANLNKKASRSRCYINATLWAGQIFGLSSLLAFVIGCYLAKAALFAQ